MLLYPEAIVMCDALEIGLHSYLFEGDQAPARQEELRVSPILKGMEVIGFQLYEQPRCRFVFDYEIFHNLVSIENRVAYILGKLIHKY